MLRSLILLFAFEIASITAISINAVIATHAAIVSTLPVASPISLNLNDTANETAPLQVALSLPNLHALSVACHLTHEKIWPNFKLNVDAISSEDVDSCIVQLLLYSSQFQFTSIHLYGSPIRMTKIIAAISPSVELHLSFPQNSVLPAHLKMVLGATRGHSILLNWSSQPMYDDVAQTIAKYIANSQIKSLDISDRFMLAIDAETLFTAMTTSNFTTLVANNLQNLAVFIILADYLPYTSITHLVLSRNRLGVPEAMAIGGALGSSKVEYLDITDNLLGTEGLPFILNALPESHHLGILKLGRNWFGFLSMPLLADVLPKSRIQELDLSENALYDKGVITLATALAHSPSLKSLHVGGCNIYENGAAAIARKLHQSNLTELDLRNNYIQDFGALALTRGIRGTSLKKLNVNKNFINKEGGDALKHLGLESLDVGDNPVNENRFGSEACCTIRWFT